jgi:hypothetical protein
MFKIGDKVKIINETSRNFNKEGIIKSIIQNKCTAHDNDSSSASIVFEKELLNRSKIEHLIRKMLTLV